MYVVELFEDSAAFLLVLQGKLFMFGGGGGGGGLGGPLLSVSAPVREIGLHPNLAEACAGLHGGRVRGLRFRNVELSASPQSTPQSLNYTPRRPKHPESWNPQLHG